MYIALPDLNVHVQVDGPATAPPLVLLHSLGCSGHVWDAPAEALARGFRVIRPDMRGHGLSGVTAGPYTIDGLASDVVAVLDALGIAAAHVAGLSIGGAIAQAVAANAPGRVLSLMLLDTAIAFPPPTMWQERAALVRREGMAPLAEPTMGRWVTEKFRTTPEAMGLRTMLLRTDPEGYAAAAEALAASDLAAGTARITAPTLILVGAEDASTPIDAALALQAAIAGSRMAVLPAVAHIPTVETPAAVVAHMLEFLSPPVADSYEAGMAVRRAVLGAAHVERASRAITDLDRDFQRYITQAAWGSVWTRPHFDRRTRSLLTLTMMAALGHHEEFKLHIRATRNTGATMEDVAELLIQVAAYAGIPAANSAMRLAKETFREIAEAETTERT